MKKGGAKAMKKIIYVFLTLCLVLTMVFASPLQILAAEEGNTVLVMKGRELVGTHEIEINVTVEENTGVNSMLLSLVYDTSVFTLTNLEYGPAFASLAPINTNPETEEGYGIYPFKFSYLGEENDISTGHMMTLRFRIKDGAPDGAYTITLQHQRDRDVTYLDEDEILTKNLLIDSAKIVLSENAVTEIETVPDSNKQTPQASIFDMCWLPILAGGLMLISGCFLFVSLYIRRNKTKKWKKL